MTAPIGQFVDSTQGRTSTNPFITIQENRAPTGNDGINNGLQVGQRWLDKADSNQEYFLLGFIASNGYIQANWVPLGGSNSVETLSGNSGGPVGVDSNSNINVVGDGTTIEVVGNPATHTLTITATESGLVQTLSDDVGTVITPTAGNIQLVGHVVEQGSTKFSTVVAGSSIANINPMSPARWIVDPLGFNGTHTTISAAIASATSGDTIWIMDGTYTEDPVLKSGVNLVGIQNNEVIVSGEISYSGTGLVLLQNITLAPPSGIGLTVSGSNVSQVTLQNCFIDCTNGQGISLTNSSGSSFIHLYNCYGYANNAIFISSGAGRIEVYYSTFENPTFSITPSIISSGELSIHYSSFYSVLQTNGTGQIQSIFSSFGGINLPAIPLSFSGTGLDSALGKCNIGSYGFACINIDSPQIVKVEDCIIFAQMTAEAITGSGTINYGGIYFDGSSVINVTTQNPVVWTAPQISTTGSWTPTIAFGGSSTGVTYSNQSGLYTKIANVVFFKFDMILSSKGTSTGNATIDGFPIVPAANTDNIALSVIQNTSLSSGYISIFINPLTSTAFSMNQNNPSSTPNFFTDANCTNTSGFQCEGFYFTS